MQQMQEFEASLGKLVAGDVTLVDALGHAQLVIYRHFLFNTPTFFFFPSGHSSSNF